MPAFELGNFEVQTRPDGSRFGTVTMYALAVMAANGNAIAQEAGWSSARSDAEAHEDGLRFAKERWPQTEGWTDHQAAIRKATLTFDLIETKPN
jgi:hypothetical protein